MQTSEEKRIKGAIALFNAYLEEMGKKFSIPYYVWASFVSYSAAWKYFSKLGFSKVQAKNIAWVLIYPRSWDSVNSKHYLSKPDKFKWYRRGDQILQFIHKYTVVFLNHFGINV